MSSVANQTVVRLKDFRAGDAVDRVSTALDTFTEQLSGSVQAWRSKAAATARSADGFVRSSPWHSVGAVALAGVAAGVLISLSARRAQRQRGIDCSDVTAETMGG